MSSNRALSNDNSSSSGKIYAGGDLLELFQTMNQGAVFQSVEGVIVSANKAAEQILGLSSKKLVGRKLTDPYWNVIREDGVNLPEEQHPVVIAMQTGKTVSNQVLGIYQRKNKTYCWVKITAIPEFMDGGEDPYRLCIIFEDITGQKQIEQKLTERVKELQAFYFLSEIDARKDITLEGLYLGVINTIPKSWQYPEIASGRILINGKEFSAENFRDTRWKLSAPIKINGLVIGTIEVVYLKEPPQGEEGLFLKEERLLLDSIAERIGRISERKQITETLSKTNAKYRLISENASDVIWVMDIDSKKFTYVSPSVQKMFGYTQNEALCKSIEEVLTPESLEKTKTLLAQYLPDFLAGKTMDYVPNELDQYRKDGTLISTEVTCALAYDDQGKIQIIGISRDMTERNQAEMALRQTEQSQRAMLEAITESVLLIKPDGTGIMANSETLERLNINQEQFTHHNVFDVLPAEVAASRKSQAELVIQTRQPVRYEDTRFDRHILNSINPILDPDGNVSQLAIFGFDITDLKQAEEEIRRLSHVIDQMADTVVITNIEGVIEYVNPAFEKLTGYSSREVIGKTPRILKSGVQPPEFYVNLWETILEGRVFVGEFNNRRKSGELFYEIKTITPASNSQGEVHFIATGKDITDRKKAEEKLLSSEHRNKVILEAIPDLLFLVKHDGTYLDYTAKSTDKLFVPPEAFIGKKLTEVLPGDVASQSMAAIDQAFEQNSLQTFEYTLTMQDAAVIFEGRVVANLKEDEAVVIIRDITERKRMEFSLQQRLRELETVDHLSKRLRTGNTVQDLLKILLDETLQTIDTQDGGIFLLDPLTNKLELSVTRGWFDQLKGLTLETSEGVNGEVFTSKQPRIGIETEWDQLLSQKTEHPIPPRCCGFFPIQSSEGVIGVLDVFVPLPRMINEGEQRLLAIISRLAGNATSRSSLHERLKLSNLSLQNEIDQRRTVQELLAAEKELLSTTLMSIAEGVIITDKERRILLYNRAAESIIGYEPSEVIGQQVQNIFQLIDPSSRQVISNLIETLYDIEHDREKDPEYKSPLLITKSGERILMSGSIAPVRTLEGQMMGHVLVFQDITEKHRAETQMVLSQKMEAIGQLAAGIAHEINTPIQYVGDNLRFVQKAVSRFTEVLDAYQNLALEPGQPWKQENTDYINALKKKNKIEHSAQESPIAIQEALDGVERVRKIVLAMREFSHPSVKEKKPADINHGIETTILISRNEWKYCADLETSLDPELPIVTCQIDEINQVVLNMIVNAAQSIQEKMPAGSEQKGRIFIKTLKVDNTVLISVQDTGKGIPEEIRMRIFDPFFTTKGVGKGTGQGLSLAHNIIVKKHKGRIKVDSIMGEGTTFTIELPIDSINKEF